MTMNNAAVFVRTVQEVRDVAEGGDGAEISAARRLRQSCRLVD